MSLVVAIFLLTYLGMALGRVPGFSVERTGIALIAVVLLAAFGPEGPEALGRHVDWPTLLLLFGLMIVSAQFAFAGFYAGCAAWLTRAELSPPALLALLMATAGGLSAVLANDIVVFAMTPILCRGLRARGLDPVPFLIGLACAANAGSAATVIGNPQNILIGQVAGLGFWRFIAICAPPALAALALSWAAVALLHRGRWRNGDGAPAPDAPLYADRNQFAKAAVATAVLIALFSTAIPREVSALLIAGALIVNRRISSRAMLAEVDWNLLLLFICLFAMTGAFAETEAARRAFAWLVESGLLPDRLAALAPLALVASNTIGNVPSVVLLLKVWPNPPQDAMYALALLSTLAGNMLLVGSLANLIVAERAAGEGVRLGFAAHAKAGIPATAISVLAACLWLSAIRVLAW
jgi:Na+/H+ antiporter NhaD/arsenite permease-like protein